MCTLHRAETVCKAVVRDSQGFKQKRTRAGIAAGPALSSLLKFCSDYTIPYVYRDPSLITTKRDSRNARLAYGVIGKWEGLEFGPFELIRVSFFVLRDDYLRHV